VALESEIPATAPTCFNTVRHERYSNMKQNNHYSDLNSSCYYSVTDV